MSDTPTPLSEKKAPSLGTTSRPSSRPTSTGKEHVLSAIESRPPTSGEYSAQAVAEAMWEELMMAALMRGLDESELVDRSTVHAAKASWEAMLVMVDWYHIEHDSGDTAQWVNDNVAWDRDPEPQPTPTDSLSRGVVPVRIKPAPQRPTSEEIAGRERPASVTSSRSRRSTTNQQRASTAQLPALPTTSTPSTASSRPASSARKPKSKSNAQPEMDPQEMLARQELARHTALKQHRKQIEAATAEEVAKFENMVADLKGKDFVFDDQGRPILLNPVDPDKLPSRAVNPAIKVKHEVEEEIPTKAKKKTKGKPPKTAEEESWFKEQKNVQPPMLDTIELKAGVSIKEGGNIKSGPKRPEDKHRMSRSDFKRMFDQGTEVRRMSATQELPKKGQQGKKDPMASTISSFGSDQPDSMNATQNLGGGGAAVVEVDSNGLAQLSSESMPVLAASSLSQEDLPFADLNLTPTKHPDKALTLGVRVREPRHRPFVQESTKHLPQPVYPGVSGHGFVTSYLAAANDYSPKSARSQNGHGVTYQRDFSHPVDRVRKNSKLRPDQVEQYFDEKPERRR